MGSFAFTDCSKHFEKGWCGVRPLSTTRSEVEKRFGKPTIDDNDYHTYITSDARIQVNYSVALCSENRYGRGEFNVPKDTVLGYYVRPNDTLGSKLLFDKDNFQEDKSGHDLRFRVFDSKELGLRIWVYVDYLKNERVSSLHYTPTEKDQLQKSCPK
ncbi:MAG: hypothetical protein ABL959_25220 [Pyrinomonadaceae bacterium]